jgi:C-terminal processing protease CtpA/Prc
MTVDGLVIDQNHNGGGIIGYAHVFLQLFVKDRANAMVEFLNVDNKWIDYYNVTSRQADTSTESSVLMTSISSQLETDARAGKSISSKPHGLDGYNVMLKGDYTWTKPILLLADELSGSSGDIFPMLMKRNKIAKIFGNRTIGLGGNVEPAGLLGNSRAKVNLTRGLFVTYKPDGNYTNEDFVENVGVTPDFLYKHTYADFMSGFPAYVESFSKAMVREINAANPPTE